MPQSLFNWVDSFLSDQKIQLMFDGQIQLPTDIEVRVPQGSPVSPILFLIYVQDIIQSQAF